jgi:hypothetical protein
MSNRARATVIAVAVVIVVVAFVVLRPSGNDDKKSDSAKTTGTTGGASAKAAGPTREQVTLNNGAPVGGVKNIKVHKGDDVLLTVKTNEVTDTLHLHGYDIEKDATKAKPAQFRFKAKVEGVFELESHTAEHAGKDPLIAHLVVEPS